MPLRTYQDAVAIVTGGASGIGAALSRDLVSRGAEVVIADLQGELAERIATVLRDSGGRATAFQLDVRDFPAMQRLDEETRRRTGRIEYGFNNAGTGGFGEVKDFDGAHWDLTLDVNRRGVIH